VSVAFQLFQERFHYHISILTGLLTLLAYFASLLQPSLSPYIQTSSHISISLKHTWSISSLWRSSSIKLNKCRGLIGSIPCLTKSWQIISTRTRFPSGLDGSRQYQINMQQTLNPANFLPSLILVPDLSTLIPPPPSISVPAAF
jgi:hypothetical protein